MTQSQNTHASWTCDFPLENTAPLKVALMHRIQNKVLNAVFQLDEHAKMGRRLTAAHVQEMLCAQSEKDFDLSGRICCRSGKWLCKAGYTLNGGCRACEHRQGLGSCEADCRCGQPSAIERAVHQVAKKEYSNYWPPATSITTGVNQLVDRLKAGQQATEAKKTDSTSEANTSRARTTRGTTKRGLRGQGSGKATNLVLIDTPQGCTISRIPPSRGEERVTCNCTRPMLCEKVEVTPRQSLFGCIDTTSYHGWRCSRASELKCGAFYVQARDNRRAETEVEKSAAPEKGGGSGTSAMAAALATTSMTALLLSSEDDDDELELTRTEGEPVAPHQSVINEIKEGIENCLCIAGSDEVANKTRGEILAELRRTMRSTVNAFAKNDLTKLIEETSRELREAASPPSATQVFEAIPVARLAGTEVMDPSASGEERLVARAEEVLWCTRGHPAGAFASQAGRDEFDQSGLCQSCQDEATAAAVSESIEALEDHAVAETSSPGNDLTAIEEALLKKGELGDQTVKLDMEAQLARLKGVTIDQQRDEETESRITRLLTEAPKAASTPEAMEDIDRRMEELRRLSTQASSTPLATLEEEAQSEVKQMDDREAQSWMCKRPLYLLEMKARTLSTEALSPEMLQMIQDWLTPMAVVFKVAVSQDAASSQDGLLSVLTEVIKVRQAYQVRLDREEAARLERAYGPAGEELGDFLGKNPKYTGGEPGTQNDDRGFISRNGKGKLCRCPFEHPFIYDIDGNSVGSDLRAVGLNDTMDAMSGDQLAKAHIAASRGHFERCCIDNGMVCSRGYAIGFLDADARPCDHDFDPTQACIDANCTGNRNAMACKDYCGCGMPLECMSSFSCAKRALSNRYQWMQAEGPVLLRHL